MLMLIKHQSYSSVLFPVNLVRFTLLAIREGQNICQHEMFNFYYYIPNELIRKVSNYDVETIYHI